MTLNVRCENFEEWQIESIFENELDIRSQLKQVKYTIEHHP
jgi:hypothetical protein